MVMQPVEIRSLGGIGGQNTINSELFDHEAKKLIRLSADENARRECFRSGLTSDLCDWFLRCNDYFIQISNAVQYSSYADTPVNVTVSMGILSIATNILRILRNMCSQSPSNQQVVLSSGMIRCISGLCMDKHLWASGEMAWSEWYELFLQVALQLIFNVTAGRDSATLNLVWEFFIPDCFLFLMKQYSHNIKLSSYAIAVVFNLVNDSQSTSHLESVIRNVDIMNLIYSRGLSEEGDGCSLASQWIVLILELTITRHSFTLPMLSISLNTLASPSYCLVSPAQLLLLSYLVSITDSDTDRILQDPLCQDLSLWLLDLIHKSNTLQSINGQWVFDQQRLSVRHEETEEGKKLCFFLEAVKPVTLILRYSIDHFSNSLKSFFLHSELLQVFFAILAIPQIDIEMESNTPMIQQRDDVWSFGTRDAVLQILGNLVYLNRQAQDLIRERGAIELILNHTKMHPKHPLQREWALFTIRNLCADNEANQRYIDGFKAQGIASEPGLAKLGVKIGTNWCVCSNIELNMTQNVNTILDSKGVIASIMDM